MLSKDIINSHFNTPDVELICLDSVDSTSTRARELVNSGNVSRLVIVADGQTGGRGRNGKSFCSQSGVGVYMSVVLHPDCDFGGAVGVTTAASVAVSRAVERVTGRKIQVKWVNDLYFENKKVCGILCEAVAKNGRVSSVIVGVGINLCESEFPEELADIAGTLGCDNSLREPLVAAVADELFNLRFGDIAEDILNEYREKSIVIDKTIDYFVNGIKNTAVAVGVDGQGGLIVKKADGTTDILRSGEITVRLNA